ncbi:hypothetical protein EDD21DRAFT_148177 [Dissophora ornata]|nr:hypothetical protein EDD21DRAFT_148177 [Dissophora ornata]
MLFYYSSRLSAIYGLFISRFVFLCLLALAQHPPPTPFFLSSCGEHLHTQVQQASISARHIHAHTLLFIHALFCTHRLTEWTNESISSPVLVVKPFCSTLSFVIRIFVRTLSLFALAHFFRLTRHRLISFPPPLPIRIHIHPHPSLLPPLTPPPPFSINVAFPLCVSFFFLTAFIVVPLSPRPQVSLFFPLTTSTTKRTL